MLHSSSAATTASSLPADPDGGLPQAHKLTDLSVYAGETLDDKIDTLTKEHSVVIVTKSWCLFSHDAKDFLVKQLGVSVWILNADQHPDGKKILSYLKKKHDYHMVPLIFIRGDFLGGFEDINSLYSESHLQENYLNGLTQADRCELEISSSRVALRPLFYFPKKVNGNTVRLTGVLTSFSSALSAATSWKYEWGKYIAYFLLFDFGMRIIAGSKLSVLGQIAALATSYRQPKPRAGRPKQFAACCGLMFSFLGSLFYLLKFEYSDYIAQAFIGMLAVASGMEGFIDFCLGCYFFKIGIKLGIFSAD